MCEKYVRKRKNRTRTVRILENMRRPTVIVESLSDHQTRLLDEAMKAWNHLSGESYNVKVNQNKLNHLIFLPVSRYRIFDTRISCQKKTQAFLIASK